MEDFRRRKKFLDFSTTNLIILLLGLAVLIRNVQSEGLTSEECQAKRDQCLEDQGRSSEKTCDNLIDRKYGCPPKSPGGKHTKISAKGKGQKEDREQIMRELTKSGIDPDMLRGGGGGSRMGSMAFGTERFKKFRQQDKDRDNDKESRLPFITEAKKSSGVMRAQEITRKSPRPNYNNNYNQDGENVENIPERVPEPEADQTNNNNNNENYNNRDEPDRGRPYKSRDDDTPQRRPGGKSRDDGDEPRNEQIKSRGRFRDDENDNPDPPRPRPRPLPPAEEPSENEPQVEKRPESRPRSRPPPPIEEPPQVNDQPDEKVREPEQSRPRKPPPPEEKESVDEPIERRRPPPPLPPTEEEPDRPIDKRLSDEPVPERRPEPRPRSRPPRPVEEAPRARDEPYQSKEGIVERPIEKKLINKDRSSKEEDILPVPKSQEPPPKMSKVIEDPIEDERPPPSKGQDLPPSRSKVNKEPIEDEPERRPPPIRKEQPIEDEPPKGKLDPPPRLSSAEIQNQRKKDNFKNPHSNPPPTKDLDSAVAPKPNPKTVVDSKKELELFPELTPKPATNQGSQLEASATKAKLTETQNSFKGLFGSLF